MVWFQCEDCGENLKKPKLPNHFRCCSANKLSCIDCGVTFGQESVQGHNQCISEMEKYGPKGQGKANNTPAKANNGAKPKPEVDINVGLSTRHPWFCSLCNTNATSQQTLLLHADGKKHRAKARAYHASKQPPKQIEESTPTANGSTVDTSKEESTVDTSKEESLVNKDVEEGKEQNPPKTTLHNSSAEENGSVPSKKKRKHEDVDSKKRDCDNSGELSNGEVIQAKRKKAEEQEGSVKKMKNKDLLKEDENADSGDTKDAKKKKIKWKKLISSVLKSNPDGALKMKKLQKLVLKSVLDSSPLEDEASLKDTLLNKINSSSKFIVDNKIVRLAAKE